MGLSLKIDESESIAARYVAMFIYQKIVRNSLLSVADSRGGEENKRPENSLLLGGQGGVRDQGQTTGTHMCTPRKTNMTMENQPFDDVSFRNCDVP